MITFDFAKRVHEIAAERKLLISHIEKDMGWNKGHLFMVLSTNNPNMKTALKVVEALGVQPSQFFNWR